MSEETEVASKGSVFCMDDLNPGQSFEMEGGGVVYLRVCAGDDLRDIRKKTVKKQKEYKKIDGNLQRLTFEEVDDDLQSQMIWDFCIVKWENFFDAAGNPIPCTTENKLKLMGRSLTFSKFVGECLTTIRGTLETEEEAVEKN